MAPLVSIVIPVYNVRSYLRECVDSVIAQTYQNIEIILVDDGSTDGSEHICDEYSFIYSNIHVIHKSNGGLSSARNVGILFSKCKYIYFLDSDDYIAHDAIKAALSTAISNKADLVFFDSICFLDNGNAIKQTYSRCNSYPIDTGFQTEKKLMKNNEFKSAVYLYLIDKRILTCHGLRFVDGIVYEDMDFTFKTFFYAEKSVFLCKKLHYRRFREGSIMTSAKGKHNFLSACVSYDAVLQFANEKNIVSDCDIRKFITRCAHSVFSCYDLLTEEEKNNQRFKLNEIKKNIKSNYYYSDYALKGRCYGSVFWFTGRVLKKIVGVIHG